MSSKKKAGYDSVRTQPTTKRTAELLVGFSGNIPFPAMRLSGDGTVLEANKESWIILSHWNTDIGQKLPREAIEQVRSALRDQASGEIELLIGFKTFLLVVSSSLRNGFVDVFAVDITQRKQIEKKLQLSAQVFESAFEAILITDADQRILDVNAAFCNITGYAREEILGENANILQSGRHGPEFYEQMWKTVNEKGSWQGEIWDRKKNGEIYPKWLSISAVSNEDGAITRYIGLFSDISTIKETEEKLFHMANYDSLTGLVNRRFFQDQLERSIQHAKRLNEYLALVFIDLDGFKFINDNLGHQTGDRALREVAERLKTCVRDTDTVARMGGDEFTVILPFLKNTRGILPVVEKILRTIVEPMNLKTSEHYISASVGIAVFPTDAEDTEELIKNADTALYRAKALGKNTYRFFSPEMNDFVRRRLRLNNQLRNALEKDDILLYYQPQYDLTNRTLVGAEALIRWHTGNDGFAKPEDFIPVAEESGLINEIGDFVTRTACAQGSRWLAANLPPLPISINLSSIQLRRPDFIDKLTSIIQASGFPPNQIEFELTEGIFIENLNDVQDKLRQLKRMGSSLVIDDFGTKYSSLAYLKKFPIDKLKIDRTFIQDLPRDGSSAFIVKTVIAMGKSLDLQVIAEGVETRAQADFLRENGCRYVQGFFFSRPLPPDELVSIRRRNA